MILVIRKLVFRLLIFPIFFTQVIFADDASTRTSIATSLTSAFTNLQQLGKVSMIAIDTHDSLNSSGGVPFAAVYADYDPSQSTPAAKYKNTLKTFNVSDANLASSLPAIAVENIDFKIDALDATSTNPGMPIFQCAVSVRQEAFKAADGVTVLVGSDGMIPPANGAVNPTASIKTMFGPASGWYKDYDNGINRQLSLVKHLSGFASGLRVFSYSSKVMTPKTGRTLISQFTSSNWEDIDPSLASIAVNKWVDFAPVSDKSSFLSGSPVIFKGGLLVDVGGGNIKTVNPFRVDKESNTATYQTDGAAASTDILRIIDKTTKAPIAANLLLNRWTAGQMAPSDSLAKQFKLDNARLQSFSSYDDGIICLTNQGIYKCPIGSIDAATTTVISSVYNKLAIPDFSRYIDVAAAGSDAGIIYLALIRKDSLLDVAKISTNSFSQISVQMVTIPVYVVSASVDRKGHFAIVDSQLHEVWWASADNIFSAVSSFDFTYLASLIKTQSSAYVRVQSQIALLKNMITSLQSQQDTANGNILEIEAITRAPGYVVNAENTARLNALYSSINILMNQMTSVLSDLKNALNDLDSYGVAEGEELAALTANRNLLETKQAQIVASQKALVEKCNRGINEILTKFGSGLGLSADLQNNLKADTGANPTKFIENLNALTAQIKIYTDAQAATLNQLQATALTWQHSVSDASSDAVTAINKVNDEAQQSYIKAQQGQIDMYSTVATLYQAELDKIVSMLVDPATISNAATVTILTASQTDLTAKLNGILTAKQNLVKGVTDQLSSLSKITTNMTNKLAEASSNYAAIKAKSDAAELEITKINAQLATQTANYQATISQKEASIASLASTNQSIQAELDKLKSSSSASSADLAAKVAALKTALSNTLDVTQSSQSVLHADLKDLSSSLKNVLGSAGVDLELSKVIEAKINSTVTALNATIASQQTLIASLQADRNLAVTSITSAVSGTAMLPDGVSSASDLVTQYSSAVSAKYDTLLLSLRSQKNSLTKRVNVLNGQIALSIPAQSTVPAEAQQVSSQPTSAALETERNSAQQQITALDGKISAVLAAKDAESTKQQGFVSAYQDAATALTTALSTPISDPKNLAALVAKLNLVSSAKDGMIRILSLQVKKLQDDLADKDAQLASNSAQSAQDLAARDTQLALVNAALAAQNTQMQQDIADKKSQITALQAQEDNLRSSKFTVIIAAQSKNYNSLTDDEQKFLSDPLNDLSAVSSALTNLVNTKNMLIAQWQQLLKNTNATSDEQARVTAILTASQALQALDVKALQDMQDDLSEAMVAAGNENVAGTTGLKIDFVAGSSLLQKFNSVMDIRKAQIEKIKTDAAEESKRAVNALNDVSNQLAIAQAAQAGLSTLSEAQKQTITNLQADQVRLNGLINEKDKLIEDSKSNLALIQQQMQKQIDDLKANNKELTDTIAAKQAIIESQTSSLAEKDRAIAEKNNYSAQLSNSLKLQQERTAMLADDLNKSRAEFNAQTLILTKAQNDLSLSQEQVRSLQAQLQSVLDNKAKTDAAYEAQIAALNELNKANKAQIQNLQKTQAVLVGQVNTLSSIIDKHIKYSELDQSDRDALQIIMKDMDSAEANLLMMIINGTYSVNDLVPYRVLWFDQDFNVLLKKYSSALTSEAKAATDASVLLAATTPESPLVIALVAVATELTAFAAVISKSASSVDSINSSNTSANLSSSAVASLSASTAVALEIVTAKTAADVATLAAGSGSDVASIALKRAADTLNAFLPADVFSVINQIIIVHRILYALKDTLSDAGAVVQTIKQSYEALSLPAGNNAENVIVQYLPSLPSYFSSTTAHEFRSLVSQAILPLLATESLESFIKNWQIASANNWNKNNSNDVKYNDRILEMVKVLTGKNPDNTIFSFETAITQLKLNAIFVQQQHATEVQDVANKAAIVAAEARADDAKHSLEQAIASGASDLASAQKTYKDALDAKDKAISDAKELMEQISDASSNMAATTTSISLNLMKRQATSENQNKNLAFFQSRMSDLSAKSQALQKALASGTGNQNVLFAILAEQERLTRNNQYAPYVFPISLSFEKDGGLVKYFRNFDILTPRGSASLFTESGLPERDGSSFENIILGCLYLPDGSAGYLDVSSVDKDGFAYLSSNNRFNTPKIKAVNRGDNLVSFEYDAAGKKYCLTLIPMELSEKVAQIRSMSPDALLVMLKELASAAATTLSIASPDKKDELTLRVSAANASVTNCSAALAAGQSILYSSTGNAKLAFANNPAAVSAANAVLTNETVNFAASNIPTFNVKFVELVDSSKVSDLQKFYLEGTAQPAYEESLIIRTHDSSNKFANDMAGYLSFKPDATGKQRIVYSPWISTEYHLKPGNKETVWGISRMDSNSNSEEASLMSLLPNMLALDNKIVVDYNSGFTAYDKSLAELLKVLENEISAVVKNNDQFQDFVLKFAEYVSYRQSKNQIRAKDLTQFKAFARTIASNIFGAGSTSNLKQNSAGYKSLFGTVDINGKPVSGSGGLLNAQDIVASTSFADLDYVSFSSGGQAIYVDENKSLSLKAISSLSKNTNFILNKDSSTGNYRLLLHPSFVDGKLAVDGDKVIVVPLSSVFSNSEDLFNVSIADGKINSVVIKNNNGYLSVVADGSSNKLKFVAGQAPDFNFEITVNAAGTFRAELVSLAGVASTTDSAGKQKVLSDLVATELGRDKTQVNKTIADTKEYIALAVNDSNRAVFAPIVQRIALAIKGAPSLAGVVDLSLVDSLESSLSLFSLKTASYFQIRDSSNSIMKIGSAYLDQSKTVVDGKDTNMTCYNLELTPQDSLSFDRSTVFRMIPHPSKAGVYLVVGYLESSGAAVYLLAKDVSVKDKESGLVDLSLSLITGSVENSFDKDGSVSLVPEEWFEVTGTMSLIKVRANSFVDQTNSTGFIGALADDISFKNAISSQVQKITDSIASLNSIVSSADAAKTNAEKALNYAADKLTAMSVASLILTTPSDNYDFSTVNPLVAQLQTSSPSAYAIFATETADKKLKTLADAQAVSTIATNASRDSQLLVDQSIANLIKAQSDVSIKRAELVTLQASLSSRPLKILKTAGEVTSSATEFALTSLSPLKVRIMLSDVNQLTKALYDILNEINVSDVAKRPALADDALSAFYKVVFGYSSLPNGSLPKVRPYLIANSFDKIVTDLINPDVSKRRLSIQDLLGFVKSDFQFNNRTRTGINFSSSAVAMIDTLVSIFIIKEPLAINDENMLRIQTYQGMDLAVALKQYNADKVELRKALTPLVAYVQNIKESAVTWLDASGAALDATTMVSNKTDIKLKNLDTLIIRQDLADSYKAALIYKVRNILAAGTGQVKDATGKVTDSALNDFLMLFLDKMQPQITTTSSGKKATKYSELELYDRLDLAENMLNGRYKDLDGKFVFAKDSTKALEVLATITDVELAAEKDVNGFTAWKIQLTALANADKKAAANPTAVSSADTFKKTIKSLGVLKPLRRIIRKRGSTVVSSAKPAAGLIPATTQSTAPTQSTVPTQSTAPTTPKAAIENNDSLFE